MRDQFGQHFDDPWDWLRDGEDPEVRAHLEAENAWADTVTAPTREAAARLVEEVKASTALTDDQGTTVNPHDLPQSASHDTLTCGSCHTMHDEKPLEETAAAACTQCHHQNVYECYTCHE